MHFGLLLLGILGAWEAMLPLLEKCHVFYQYENTVKNKFSVPLKIPVKLLA